MTADSKEKSPGGRRDAGEWISATALVVAMVVSLVLLRRRRSDAVADRA